MWEITGIIAAILTTGSFVPQICKGIKTRRMDDVSMLTYAVSIIGMALWLSYGVHLGDSIIIAANAVGITFASTILLLKQVYKSKI